MNGSRSVRSSSDRVGSDANAAHLSRSSSLSRSADASAGAVNSPPSPRRSLVSFRPTERKSGTCYRLSSVTLDNILLVLHFCTIRDDFLRTGNIPLLRLANLIFKNRNDESKETKKKTFLRFSLLQTSNSVLRSRAGERERKEKENVNAILVSLCFDKFCNVKCCDC